MRLVGGFGRRSPTSGFPVVSVVSPAAGRAVSVQEAGCGNKTHPFGAGYSVSRLLLQVSHPTRAVSANQTSSASLAFPGGEWHR